MEINDFLVSPISEVKDFAERAVKLKAEFEARLLTTEEYTELTDDLLALKHINEASISIEVSRELWTLVDILKNIKFFASLV
jgi:hypothetical protein